MKKHILFSLFCLPFLLSVVFCMVGCEESEHVHSYVDVIVDATCTTSGYTIHKCACGDEYKDTIVTSLGHSYGMYTSNNDATCESDGTKSATCIRCDNIDTITDVNSNTGHSYVDEIVSPTCTTSGYTIHKCACGNEYKDTIVTALGHSYGDVQTVMATCTLDGYTYHICNVCGYFEKIEILEKTGHIEEVDEEKGATCTETGLTQGSHCKVCNSVIVAQKVIEKIDHIESDWIYDENISCTKTREKHKVCTVCNTILEVETAEPQGHDFFHGKCMNCLETIYTRSGNIITFGSYPQSKVTDEDLCTTLTNLAGTLPTSSSNEAWTNYGYYSIGKVANYMWYIDEEYNGEKYRGVYFTEYRGFQTSIMCSSGNSYQDDNGYNINTVYWFKYEPISWRILSETASKALIMCTIAIDSQQFDASANNNYKDSDIRKWLNETFYALAFNDLQKELIQTVTVDNSLVSVNANDNASYYNNGVNNYVCDDTVDKIFLLSANDASCATYGYKSALGSYDTSRRIGASNYALVQGAYKYGNNCIEWLLRSPYYGSSYKALYINESGYVCYDRDIGRIMGVVPTLYIEL